MYPFNRPWSVSSFNRHVYQFDPKKHYAPSGYKLKKGSLCLCVEHTGDGFHDYLVLQKTDNGKYKKSHRIGTYSMGKPVAVLPTRDFFLIQAGEQININFCKPDA